jgi:hypothetical protein
MLQIIFLVLGRKIIPFPPQIPNIFDRPHIEAVGPNLRGVYGLFRQGECIYVGKGDIRQRLLAHLNGDNPRIIRERPTHWVAEVTPNMDGREIQLIKEFRPICSQRAGWLHAESIEDGRVVPMTKRPTKIKKLEGAFPSSTMTAEEKKDHNERTDRGLVKLGLFIITGHLQKFVENRSLQAVLKEHDLVVSWDDEKKKVVVVTSPRRPAESKNGYESRPRTASR